MRLIIVFLVAALAAIGISGSYQLTMGSELAAWGGAAQAESGVGRAADPSPVTVPRPAPLPTAEPAHQGEAFEPFWVQNYRETDLWSGTDSEAVSFGQVPQWSYFQVVAPQQERRLYVLNPLTQGHAYIDASAVGPSPAPPRDYRLATAGTTLVVGNTDGLGVYVRRSPEMGDRLRAWPDGTAMEVLERDIQGDGHSWAKVKSPDGAEGYVPQEYLVDP